MQLRIVLLQLWRDLKAHRLRSGLTLFGIAWGTFCVVVMLAFGNGLQAQMMKTQGALGGNLLLLWGARTTVPFEGLPRDRYVRLADDDVDAIARDVVEVQAISPEYTTELNAKGPAGEANVTVSGVLPAYAGMRRVEAESGGRFLSERDVAERRRVCVIGYQVRRDLFGEEPAVGRTLTMNGTPFTVVGTVAKKRQDSNYNGQDDSHVFVPSTAAVASLGLQRPDNLVIELRERVRGRDAIPLVRGVLAARHRFDAADEGAVQLWDVGEGMVMIQNIFLGFKLFLGLLGSFTLAVAAIGVANTMSMVVEDRTPHIGIAMALGARQRWVLGQVLLETVCFTAIGGLLGVGTAAGIVWAAGFLPLEDTVGAPQISAATTAVTVAMLAVCGILAGVGPARRAAAMNPAAALRT